MRSILLFLILFKSAWCASLEQMSLEEKVGQLLMAHFNGQSVNEDAKVLIEEVKVGAIIYYNWSNGLHSPEQVRQLSFDLQKLAKRGRLSIPLLIAADQEGGRVARLRFTNYPGNAALAITGDCELAKKSAFAIGEELASVGINMNLAPVVDVNSNPKNPVIGARSFGDNPDIVSAFGKQALAGYKAAGIISTLKHFPGYGDVFVDPHQDLPIVYKSMEELEKVELAPFTKLAPFADAIMTAHILMPAFDADRCATLSEKALRYLRETIGFEGVIVADSLIMDGVLKKCHSVEEASIQAFNAGCDLLILGGKLLEGQHSGFELTVADVKKVHTALVNAVKKGRIDEAKLNKALFRILHLKERLSAF